MNLEPSVLMALVVGLMVVAFGVAGLVIVVTKARKRRHDAKSLPQGNVNTVFTDKLNRSLAEDPKMFENEDYFA